MPEGVGYGSQGGGRFIGPPPEPTGLLGALQGASQGVASERERMGNVGGFQQTLPLTIIEAILSMVGDAAATPGAVLGSDAVRGVVGEQLAARLQGPAAESQRVGEDVIGRTPLPSYLLGALLPGGPKNPRLPKGKLINLADAREAKKQRTRAIKFLNDRFGGTGGKQFEKDTMLNTLRAEGFDKEAAQLAAEYPEKASLNVFDAEDSLRGKLGRGQELVSERHQMLNSVNIELTRTDMMIADITRGRHPETGQPVLLEASEKQQVLRDLKAERDRMLEHKGALERAVGFENPDIPSREHQDFLDSMDAIIRSKEQDPLGDPGALLESTLDNTLPRERELRDILSNKKVSTSDFAQARNELESMGGGTSTNPAWWKSLSDKELLDSRNRLSGEAQQRVLREIKFRGLDSGPTGLK